MLKKTRRILAIVVIMTALCVLSARLVINHFAMQKDFFQNLASKVIETPVTIHHVAVQWRGFYPVFVLRDVVISDQNNHPAVRINRLNMGMDILASVIHREFIPGTLEVSGATLGMMEDANGQWQLLGMDNGLQSHPAAFKDWFNWLLSQKKIVLSDIEVLVKKKTNQTIPISIQKIQFYQSLHGVKAQGEVNFLQPKPGSLSFLAELSKPHQFESLKATLYLEGKNIDLSTWLSGLSFSNYSISSGLVDTKLWLVWDKQNWRKVEAIIDGEKISIKDDKKTYLLDTQQSHIKWQFLEASGWQIESWVEDLSYNGKPLVTEPLFMIYRHDKSGDTFQIEEIKFSLISRLLNQFPLVPQGSLDLYKQMNPKGEIHQFYLKKNGENYFAQGELVNLSATPVKTIPGGKNISGRFQIIPNEGYFVLESKNLTLNFPRVFRYETPLTSAKAVAHWMMKPEGFQVDVDEAQVENSDGAVYGKFSLFFPKNSEYPYLSLLAGGKLTSLNHEAWYLPYSVMPNEVVQWVDAAILQGDAKVLAGVVINGPMEHFPFDNNEGQFIVDANLENLSLNYLKSWPPLKNVSGNVVFHQRSMNLKTATAQYGQSTQLHDLQALIPSMGGKDGANLHVTGSTQGPISDALTFIQTSPLNEILKQRFEGVKGEGPLSLKLRLMIPLSGKQNTVSVNGEVMLHENSLSYHDIPIKKVNGMIQFTESWMFSPSISAKIYDQNLSGNIEHQTKNGITQTQAIIQGAFTAEWLEKLFDKPLISHYLKGGSQFKAVFNLFHGGNAPSDSLIISSDLKGTEINLPNPLKKDAATLSQASLKMSWDGKGTDLQFTDGKTQLSMNTAQGESIIGVTNSLVDGQIDFSNYPKALKLKLNYLNLSEASGEKHESLSPDAIPVLDVDCENLSLGNKPIGHLTLLTTPSHQGMEILKLNVNAQNFQLRSRGSWTRQGREEVSKFTGNLTSDNTAGMLSNFGIAPGVVSNQANMNFTLGWQGSPMDFNSQSLSGNVAIKIKNGSIPDVSSSTNLKLGLGRIITLLSFQSLQQKLQLNFNDFTQKGYSFNVFSGQLNLKSGQAYTQDLMMDGPIAKIKMVGRIGLSTRDYDMQVAITPYVTSSIPVIATIAGGPVVGAVAWITDKVLSSAVQKITTYHYQVTGPWDKPNIQHE